MDGRIRKTNHFRSMLKTGRQLLFESHGMFYEKVIKDVVSLKIEIKIYLIQSRLDKVTYTTDITRRLASRSVPLVGCDKWDCTFVLGVGLQNFNAVLFIGPSTLVSIHGRYATGRWF